MKAKKVKPFGGRIVLISAIIGATVGGAVLWFIFWSTPKGVDYGMMPIPSAKDVAPLAGFVGAV